MTEKEKVAFADKIAAAKEKRGFLLMSRVFSDDAKTLLAGKAKTTVMVMVDTQENGGKEALKKLGETLDAAPEKEKVIYELRPDYGDAKVTANSHVLAALPSVRPEITDIYPTEPIPTPPVSNKEDSEKNYMASYNPSSIPPIYA